MGHASESLSLRVVLWTQYNMKTLTRRKLDSLYIIRESDFRTAKNIKGKKGHYIMTNGQFSKEM